MYKLILVIIHIIIRIIWDCVMKTLFCWMHRGKYRTVAKLVAVTKGKTWHYALLSAVPFL